MQSTLKTPVIGIAGWKKSGKTTLTVRLIEEFTRRGLKVAIFEGGPDLQWEADIAWVIKGGGDPLYWIETFGPKISAVHLKDIAPEGQNADEDGWADLGEGAVDWKGLMAALKNTPVKYFVMEHDNPKDATRFATRSLAAAKKL